jgi:Tfp pilus assembly protein PilO
VKARVAGLSDRTKIALAAGAVLVYALAVWFLVVGPKRAEVASLRDQVSSAELQLATSRAQASRPKRPSAPVADVVRLAKAMPASSDTTSLLLEVTRTARRSSVALASIAPDVPDVDSAGATVVPVTVTVTGTYRQVTNFLRYMRDLVRFRGGTLDATGRLFNVTGVELSESSAGKFPLLDATITFDAYAYDGPIVAPTPTPPPGGDATSTSTSGATAAGSTR